MSMKTDSDFFTKNNNNQSANQVNCVKLLLIMVITLSLVNLIHCYDRCDCGRTGIQRRVFGGNETYNNQYPWMAHLRFYDHVGSTQYGLCGGSLIDHQHIVTAAHCVHDASGNPRNVDAVHVYLGAHNLYHLPKVRRVEKFILPKNYNFERPVHNDFAVLRLTKPVKFNDKVSPICIPKTDDEPYRKLRVAGWGHLGPNQKTAKILQHVDVYHVKNNKCYEMVKDYIYSNYAVVRRNPEKYKIPPIHENHMCAVDGNTGGDACQGDSGGPLMYLNPGNNRFYLIGIVSGAYDQCGDKHTPGFYTLVRNFRYMVRDLAPNSHICHY